MFALGLHFNLKFPIVKRDVAVNGNKLEVSESILIIFPIANGTIDCFADQLLVEHTFYISSSMFIVWLNQMSKITSSLFD